MKIDYQKTIDELKENGLIKSDDKCAFCLFQAESESNGVTSTILTSKTDYIMAANIDEINLFDIDKKTGEYLGSFLTFKKDDVTYAKKIKERNFIWASKGIFGGRNIAIHFIADSFVHDYLLPKKQNGFEQNDARSELFDFIKTIYNTHYTSLEKLYKGK